jgi:hypothetical protein
LLGVSTLVQAADYEVTITNLTRHQIFSPLLVVSHKDNMNLFQAGHEASDELAAIAETGNVGPMEDALMGLPGVSDFANTGAVLLPGMSDSVVVQGRPYTRISVLSMLVNSNDAFLALNSQPATIWRPVSVQVPAYDAGSEANSELCSDIPGPACPPDSGNAHADEGEGFIHIHNGIHGIGDPELDPAEYDWRNPVAAITIKRVR